MANDATTMFVIRFRTTTRRLQVSLIVTRRSAGKVRHEYIACLGSAPIDPSPGERMRSRPACTRGSRGSPTASMLKQRTRSSRLLWDELHRLHTDRIEGGRELQEHAKRMIADSEAEAGKVAEALAVSRARLARAQAREAVAVPSQMTAKEMFKVLGWTKADQRHAERLNEIHRVGGRL